MFMNKLKKKILSGVQLAYTDPLNFLYRVNLKLNIIKPHDKVIWRNGVAFCLDSNLVGTQEYAEMFFGVYQRLLIKALRRHLGKGGVFVDVGANVGYVSSVALSLVGQSGRVYAFEPVPKYFDKLLEVKKNNDSYNFFPNNIAVGDCDAKASIKVVKFPYIGGSTMVDGFRDDLVEKCIDVPVVRLDNYLNKQNVDHVDLIKIDVEGYEFFVLKGLEKFISYNKSRPVIIVEIMPHAYKDKKLLRELSDYMKNIGYKAYDIECKVLLDVANLERQVDAVFLPAQ